MKLGLYLAPYKDMDPDRVLEKIWDLNLDTVEIGVANYAESAFFRQLEQDHAISDWVERLAQHDITISALSCQGNPLHPKAEIAQAHHAGWRRTVEWARRLTVNCVNVFAGCPGEPTGTAFPNWVTTPWPNELQTLLKWQWDQVAVPYWTREVEWANQNGVSRIAFEMHPGFIVYNPKTLLQLRSKVGSSSIGANFDPSHLMWQGMDFVEAARFLASEGVIFNVHMKDVRFNARAVAESGLFDPTPYGEASTRAWNFAAVGDGHDQLQWNQLIRVLQDVGYQGSLTVEHEDAMLDRDEGILRSIRRVQSMILRESPGAMWWVN